MRRPTASSWRTWARPSALKREHPETVVGVGGCWAQSVKDEVFARFPFVDVAFGPGQVHKLAEFLTERLAHRPGLLRVRGLHRAPAGQARARVPGLGADLRRLQLRLLVLHRALHPRARGQSRPRRAVAGGRAAGRRRGARGHAARPERQLLRPRPAARGEPARPSRSCCAAVDAVAGIERIRYTSPHPQDMREDVIRAHAELPRAVRARPPAAAVGLQPRCSRRCGAPTRASATSTASR